MGRMGATGDERLINLVYDSPAHKRILGIAPDQFHLWAGGLAWGLHGCIYHANHGGQLGWHGICKVGLGIPSWIYRSSDCG